MNHEHVTDPQQQRTHILAWFPGTPEHAPGWELYPAWAWDAGAREQERCLLVPASLLADGPDLAAFVGLQLGCTATATARRSFAIMRDGMIDAIYPLYELSLSGA